MLSCPSCGTVADEQSHFCMRCGASLAPGPVGPAPATPGQHPPPPYAYGNYGQPWPQVQKTNGYAIASLVLGIIPLCGIGGILALIFGYMAKNQIDNSGGAEGGRGLAIAGIVLGWIWVGLFALFVVFAIIGAIADTGSSSQLR